MITKILKTIGLSILFFVIFLVLTFPYDRLSPKIKKLLEQNIFTFSGISAVCTIDGLRSPLPSVFVADSVVCVDEIMQNKVVELSEPEIVLLPKHQTISATVGKGRFKIKANSGISTPPTRFTGEFLDYPVTRMLPFLMGVLNRTNSGIPKYIKAEGKITGQIDWPLFNLTKESGRVDLQFPDLKFPQQSQLDLIGVKDLSFSKAVLKINLAKGKLTIPEAQFLSSQLSGKAEGNIELSEDLRKSVGSLSLKWKIEKSDAVLSSLLGPMIANNCPSPDSDGFCTRKVQRVSDLGM